MFGPWTPLAVFVAGFLLVIFLTRWITRHMQGIMFLLGADEEVIMYLQFILFFPGILVHEVSHWITAQLLGVRTLHFSIWPKKKGKGKVQYGAVRIEQTDVFRASLIGLAPLVVASLLIILIGRYALGTEALRQVVAMGQWNQLWSALVQAARVPDFWLWMYLIFAISNAMFPSSSDREVWKPLIIYGLVAGGLVYLSGWKPPMESVQSVLAQAMNPLIYAFGITAAVDIFFAIVIGVVEIVLGRVLGNRVLY
jgi:hypothetical protein